MMTEALMVVEPHEDDRTAPSAFVSQAKPSQAESGPRTVG